MDFFDHAEKRLKTRCVGGFWVRFFSSALRREPPVSTKSDPHIRCEYQGGCGQGPRKKWQETRVVW
jgi:hypothetical protein